MNGEWRMWNVRPSYQGNFYLSTGEDNMFHSNRINLFVIVAILLAILMGTALVAAGPLENCCSIPECCTFVQSITPHYAITIEGDLVGATVTIRNVAGLPVEDALVSVAVTPPTGPKVLLQGRTNGSGRASVFMLTTASGMYTFTVEKVGREGLSYDARLNLETSDCISIPFLYGRQRRSIT